MTWQNQKDGAWATLFEVYLAARKFNCIIHVFRVENVENGIDQEHYCFEPDPLRRIQGSKTPTSIFLSYCIREDTNFHFKWYRLRPQISRTGNLFTALQNWLKQDDVRPISCNQLGKDEAEFKWKCSNILSSASSRSGFQDVVKGCLFKIFLKFLFWQSV